MIFIDEDLTTGLQDGSSWPNAYQAFSSMVSNEATTLTEDTDLMIRSNGVVSLNTRALNSVDGWVVGSFILRLIGDTNNIPELFYNSQFDRVFQSDLDNIEVHNINFDGGNRSVELLGSNQTYVNSTTKNSGSAGFHKAGDTGAGGKCFAINCIAYSSNGSGFVASAFRNLEVTNCYSGNNTSLDYDEETNGVLTIITSASEDLTGSAGLQSVPYSTSTFTNVTAGTEDFHLVPGSSLIDAGTVTSYLTDIDGDTWSVPREIGIYNFEAGGTTYNVSVTETLTLSDLQSATLEMPASVLEQFSLSDIVSEAGGTVYNVSVEESFSFSDNQSTNLIMPISVNESFTLDDVIDSTASYLVSIVENMSLSDIISSGEAITGQMFLTITASKSEITISAIKPEITIEAEEST